MGTGLYKNRLFHNLSSEAVLIRQETSIKAPDLLGSMEGGEGRR